MEPLTKTNIYYNSGELLSTLSKKLNLTTTATASSFIILNFFFPVENQLFKFGSFPLSFAASGLDLQTKGKIDLDYPNHIKQKL